MANERANPSELRAAAAWGLSSADGSLPMLLPLTCDADESHCGACHCWRSCAIDATNVAGVLQQIGSDHRQAAGLVRTVLSSRIAFLPEAIRQLQGAVLGRGSGCSNPDRRSGPSRAEPVVRQLAPNLQQELDFFWTHHASNWTNRLDVADQIDFLEQQSAR